jgi:hypothetical protein
MVTVGANGEDRVAVDKEIATPPHDAAPLCKP